MAELICSICGARVVVGTGPLPEGFPFCSPRCRDADLYRWFHEEYAVPVETNRVVSEAMEDLERRGLDAQSGIEQN